MIYSGYGYSLNFPSSGSGQKFRIHAEVDVILWELEVLGSDLVGTSSDLVGKEVI